MNTHSTSTQILFLAAFVLSVSVSCTRAAKSSSTLTIRLPAAPAQLSQKSVSAMTSHSPWSGEITTSSEINCYAVFVGGPSPDLSFNSCKEKTTGVELVRFGIYAGGVPAGQAISLDVPSGPARTITLLAMQAQAGACISFKGSGPADGQLSHPRIIETRTVNLAPGDVSLSFNVPSSLSSLKQIDECQVSDMPTSGSGGTQFWGDGRDGSISIPASTNAYLDGTSDTLGSFFAAAHTPAAGGVASTKMYAFSARVSSIDTATGKTLTLAQDLPSTSELDSGDMVVWHVLNGWASTSPDANACGGGLGRGTWGMSRVASVNVASDTVTLETAVSASPGTLNNTNIGQTSFFEGTAHCTIQLVRVSQFENVNLAGGAMLEITAPNYSSANGKGALVAVWIKNLSMTTGSTLLINQSGYGHPSTNIGAYGISGGGTGSAFENRGGNLASAGGGGANAGGGSASSASAGSAITLCSGAPCRPFGDQRLILGGGGGGNGSAQGGAGGGVVIAVIENITGSGTININASGANAAAAGGAGAGGTIGFYNKSSAAGVTINLTASGGNGVTGGGNGGGGVIEKGFCGTQQAATYVATAAAGTGGGGTAGTGQVYSENFDSTDPALCN